MAFEFPTHPVARRVNTLDAHEGKAVYANIWRPEDAVVVYVLGVGAVSGGRHRID
jgi:hypothetical protein